MSDPYLKVLLIEDNPGDARLIREMLLDVPNTRFDVEHADRLASGLVRIREGDVHAVLLDLGLPDSRGHETFIAAQAEASQIPIIVLTGLGDEVLALRTVQDGAQDYLVKGQVDANLLERAIRYGVERKKAEHALWSSEMALRRSEANFRSLVLNSPYAIFRTGSSGKILDANPALVGMLGYQSDAELTALELSADVYSDPTKSQHLVKLLESQTQFQGMEVEWKRKDGKVIAVSLTGRPVRDERGTLTHFEMIAEEVSQRKALEAQLRQSQKMESVGRLAGGVAHDFNNLLSVILGYSEVLEDSPTLNSEHRKHAGAIKKAGLRAASLTRQLLAFSRQQILEPKVLNLNTVVADMEEMLRRLIGEDIELTTALDPALGQIQADQGQIEQIIMNLIVNARDAMPQGGKLSIETANVDLDEVFVQRRPPTTAGPYVLLAVTDTGSGMDKEKQAHIFEPFFTTKGKDKGTGLGLAVVYGVVKQSSGYIWVYSEPGKGSSFKIYLPRVHKPVEMTGNSADFHGSVRGSETILLVEDEESLRGLTHSLLVQHGYNVLQASDGTRALETVRQYQGRIHLLLTDVVMPGTSGRTLAEKMAVHYPDTKVLFMSGYTDYAVVAHGVLDGGTFLLQKPFTRDALMRKVREVLDAKIFVKA